MWVRDLSLMVALCGLSACGVASADGAAKVLFAEISAEEQALAVDLATGGSYELAIAVLGRALDDAASGCPVQTSEAGVRVLSSTGCTGASGLRYAGSIRADNALVEADLRRAFGKSVDVDLDAQTRITFEDFDVTSVDKRFFLTGVIAKNAAAPRSGVSEQRVELQISTGAISTGVVLARRCEGASCQTLPGASAEIGNKPYAFEGTYGSKGRGAGIDLTGKLSLKGRDRLDIDFDAGSGQCGPFTIEGRVAGDLCDPPIAREISP